MSANLRRKIMVYSDSHAHLDSFPQEELDLIFAQMKAKQVELVLNVSINLLTSAEAIKIAQKYSNVYAAVGIHPGETIPLTAEIKKSLEELSGQQRVVGFGEIGLMYGQSTGTTEQQQELFGYQLSLANNLHLPIDIHYSNNSHRDIVGIVKKAKGATGIVHDGIGSMSQLNEWLELGFYISVGLPHGRPPGAAQNDVPGMTDEIIRAIPLDRLITETDCMARGSVSRWNVLGKAPGGPPPGGTGPGGPGGTSRTAGSPPPMQEEFRQPTDVLKAAERIAAIRKASAEEIGKTATTNLKRLLKVN